MNARIVGPHLSPRQAQVLTAASDGRSLSAVAAELGLTREAVASHLSRVYERLDVTWLPRGERREAAVRAARRNGLIPDAPPPPIPAQPPKRHDTTEETA